MAFDGPTPFDGDPVYMYLDEVEWDQPDDVVRAIREAFEQTREEPYVEVDEGVWAWAAARPLIGPRVIFKTFLATRGKR